MSVTRKQSHSFHYNAHGHGLSAQFHRPFEQIIDVQAGTSLPIIGGHGSARVDNFKFKEIVSFKAAYTHVSGSQSKDKEDGSYGTLVTATVEHLNVLDVVTSDRIVARVASHHVPGEEEPRIIPLGSKFENLQIACHLLKIELDTDLFCECGTYTAFKTKYEKDKKFRDMVRERFLWGELATDVPEFIRSRYNWSKGEGLPESRGTILCSLVKSIEGMGTGVKRHGHVLVVPQFGRVFLGEILIDRYSRRVTMLRIELGCSVAGVLSASEGSGNGSPWP